MGGAIDDIPSSENAKAPRRRLTVTLVALLLLRGLHRLVWIGAPWVLYICLSLVLVPLLAPKDATYPTIYYFFPDYRGSQGLADVFNAGMLSVFVAWWLFPWMIGLGVLLALTHALWRKPLEWLSSFYDSLGPNSAAQVKPVAPAPTASRYGSKANDAPIDDTSSFQQAQGISLAPASHMRDALDIASIIFSSAFLFLVMLLVLVATSTAWRSAEHLLAGNATAASSEWNGVWVGLLVISGLLVVLAVVRLVHRRLLAALYLLILAPAALLLLLYVGLRVVAVWSEQFSQAAPAFAEQDWSVILNPLAASAHPTSGLVAAACALGVLLLGEVWRRTHWIMSGIAAIGTQAGGISLIVLGAVWLVAAALPIALPMDSAPARLALWLQAGWPGLAPLASATLSVVFAVAVGGILLTLAGFVAFLFLRPAFLFAFSRRLTFGSARYPIARRLWPHLLMVLGFAPANYLGQHSRRLSKSIHFMAKVAGAASFWALITLVVSTRSFLTLPMFEDLFGDAAVSSDVYNWAFTVCVIALGVGVVLTLLGNRMRPRVLQALTSGSDVAPVLFLRPFQDNRGSFTMIPWLPWRPVDAPTNLAEALLDTAGCWAPVVGIGRPEDEYEPHGPAAVYVHGSDWKTVVAEMAKSARAIVVLLDHSEGVRWEIEHLKSCGYLDKSIFLFRSTATYDDALKLASLLQVTLPGKAGRIPVCLGQIAGSWQFWTSKSYTASDLRVALMRWFLLRFGHPPGAWAVPRLEAATRDKSRPV